MDVLPSSKENQLSVKKCFHNIFESSFFGLRGRFPSLLGDFCIFTKCPLQDIRIMVGDVGFEPGTSAPEKFELDT